MWKMINNCNCNIMIIGGSSIYDVIVQPLFCSSDFSYTYRQRARSL